jgi:hypothetical protein
LKNFSKVFNQNKAIGFISSPDCKFGAYNWSILADVKMISKDKFYLLTCLQCKSEEKNFPISVLMNFSISHNENDSKRDFKKGK